MDARASGGPRADFSEAVKCVVELGGDGDQQCSTTLSSRHARKPCATARGIEADDLRDGFEFGGAGDLARQAEAHDSTTTF